YAAFSEAEPTLDIEIQIKVFRIAVGIDFAHGRPAIGGYGERKSVSHFHQAGGGPVAPRRRKVAHGHEMIRRVPGHPSYVVRNPQGFVHGQADYRIGYRARSRIAGHPLVLLSKVLAYRNLSRIDGVAAKI